MTQAYLVKFRLESRISADSQTAILFLDDLGQGDTEIDWFVDDIETRATGHLVFGRLPYGFDGPGTSVFNCTSVHRCAVLLQVFETVIVFDGQFIGACAAKARRLAEGLDPDDEDQPSLFSIQ